MFVLTLALVGATPEAPPVVLEAPQQVSIVGVWMGTVESVGMRLGFTISEGADGTLTSTLESPDQGANGVPTGETTFIDGKLVVTVPAASAGFEGTLEKNGTITGNWSQGGQSIPLSLEHQAGGVEAPNRPQEPKGPVPYSAEDVRYPNPAGGNELAGTLTLPEGAGPFATVIMISGSGPQNRNEELLGHKPFLVIADHFTRNGIAVLRFDDRGVGESTGNIAVATSADFATDVSAGVDFLLTRSDVDHSQIGLVGHSEGGLIAPMVAADRDDVAFIVLMAGPGMSGAEILYDQAALIMEASGVPAEYVENNKVRQREMFAYLADTEDEDVVEGFRTLVTTQFEAMSEAEKAATGAGGGDQAINAAVAQLTSPWFRFFLEFDPVPTLERVSVPVLAINGALDLQVPADANLNAIEAALKRGGNRDFTIRKLDRLNHLFQTSTTGAPSEYTEIEETTAPVALEAMTKWILEHVR